MLKLPIGKTSNPSHPKQSLILSTMSGNESFFGHNIDGEGGVGGWWVETKADQKIVVRFRVLCNNWTWKGFFKESQVLFPPLSEIDLEW